jgi:hypothetical protein
VITRQDVETAQAVLDAWTDARSATGARDLPHLRGLITQALADAHAVGYDEGVVRGRRLVAAAVRDALDGEGL